MKLIGNLNKPLLKRPYLFRIELMDRFYKILSDSELIFVKPNKWEDPLENLIFNAKILKNGVEYKHPAKDKIYGQCWSYEGDSYGIWKIYTTKDNDDDICGRHMGVRITTHIDKLETISQLNDGDFYFGVVDYLWKKDLENLPKNKKIIAALRDSNINEGHLATLLKKRKSYSYENEVRLLSIPVKSMIDKQKDFLCHIKINPLDFITSIRFDPGMNYSDFRVHKDKLVDDYRFKPSQITQSTYFKKNKFVINL